MAVSSLRSLFSCSSPPPAPSDPVSFPVVSFLGVVSTVEAPLYRGGRDGRTRVGPVLQLPTAWLGSPLAAPPCCGGHAARHLRRDLSPETFPPRGVGGALSSAPGTLGGLTPGFIPPVLGQLAAFVSLRGDELVAVRNPSSLP